MSLDVYLKRNRKDNEIETFNKDEIIHLQINYEIYKLHDGDLSFDKYISQLPTGWRRVANRDNTEWQEDNEELYWSNITHNLGDMASKAGIYEACWRPYMLHSDYVEPKDYVAEMEFEEAHPMFAKDIILLLEKGYEDMKTRPEYYKQFDSENGWGTYDNFLPWVKKYFNACKEYPDAEICVSR